MVKTKEKTNVWLLFIGIMQALLHYWSWVQHYTSWEEPLYCYIGGAQCVTFYSTNMGSNWIDTSNIYLHFTSIQASFWHLTKTIPYLKSGLEIWHFEKITLKQKPSQTQVNILCILNMLQCHTFMSMKVRYRVMDMAEIWCWSQEIV